jgi:HEAT repeat protein
MTSDAHSDLAERRRALVVAGHRGDEAAATAGLDDPDPVMRELALGALQRIGVLDGPTLTKLMADTDRNVRRRVAELAATHPSIDLMSLLDDDDPMVVETAVWACGEHEVVSDEVLTRIIDLTTSADDPLVREAGAAALGAIGDERGLDAILAACTDKPAVRRRAVLALAPFDGDRVDAAIETALSDRDWQVRQSAEDLRR